MSASSRRRRALLQRLLPILLLAVAIVGVPALLFSTSGLSRLDRLERERQEAELEMSRLGKQIDELRAEVREVREEPAAVERVARDELGLVRQTEVVFHFKK